MGEGEPVERPTQATNLRRSSRDLDEIQHGLQRWLVTRLPETARPEITELSATSATGMSSDTLLFSARWIEAGAARRERLVARLAPHPDDVPVFPAYDMERQFQVIRLVGETSKVPVPRVWWCETEASFLGTPFFVMEQVDGDVPPDVMPYNFGDSWLGHSSPAEQRRLQDASVAVLAELHAIERPEETFAFLAFDVAGDTALRRHVAHTRAWYEFAAADAGRSPTVERGFSWLEGHWPADEGPTVASWGDARIGNVLYRDFEPVAVLDWEMAALGPREIDLAWMIYAHRFFEDLAAKYGLPGMPAFMRPHDVVAIYERLSGHAVRALEFFLVYAAVQFGVVGLRTGMRQVRFGERERPEDVDELLMNRETLAQMVGAP